MRRFLFMALCLVLPASSQAQDNKGVSVGERAKDNSVASELASFEIADGYEVSLFASEEHGIANPVAMRWGPRGRLWVLCSLVYPQIVPTDAPNDKLYILEDFDHDGRADKASVFADGLDMPTGFALGNGGVYLGEGDDLIFLTDTDADDRADKRELILSGFGTGDTHQNINSFTWSPGGELLFCQGLHNFSRVETPWGIVRMDEHGVWRLRPKRRQLHAFRGGSGQNPWGLAFGQWGEPFAKGNNTELSELLPVMVHTEARHRPLDIGATRVKSMICEIVDSPALPDDLQGDVIIAGYFAHIVDRLKMSTDSAGHRGQLLPPLFRTDHQSFRPVDIQTGPDGALYVADWYNPIIGHYQASLRHPDRDKIHGRIWRVTAKGMNTVPPVDLSKLPAHVLLDHLKTSPLKERERIRITLSDRDGPTVLVDVAAWIRSLDQTDPNYEHHLYEALCLYEWNETINRPLLDLLLKANNPLARAYATRVVGRWHDRMENPLEILEISIADPHPRVRLEAIVAASFIPTAEAAAVALRALDQPTDRFLNAALLQCLHARRENWHPALTSGTLRVSNPSHLAHLLSLSGGGQTVQAAKAMLQKKPLAPELRDALLALLATHSPDLSDEVLTRAATSLTVIEGLLARTEAGRAVNSSKLPGFFQAALGGSSEEIKIAAMRLSTRVTVPGIRELILPVATDPAASLPVRSAAIDTLRRNDPEERALLRRLAREDPAEEIRHAALRALAPDSLAGEIANDLLRKASGFDEVKGIVTPFLGHKTGPTVLAKSLGGEALPAELATHIRAVLGAAGRHEPSFDRILNPTPAGGAIGLPVYSEQFVRELSAEVKSAGDAKRGSDVYHRDALACTMCHVIDFCGRPLGPELSAVGAGLPIELIIEAVVWPDRQVKEGFLSTSITTRDGKILNGFIESESKTRILIRDAASEQTLTVLPGQVATRQDAGTLMPPGLTSTLSRTELRDLVRFLSERKGKPRPPAPTP